MEQLLQERDEKFSYAMISTLGCHISMFFVTMFFWAVWKSNYYYDYLLTLWFKANARFF